MAKKIEMLNDQQEVVHPLTSSDCVIMENGKTLEEVMGDGIATPTVTHEGASFQVGVGDSNIEVVDGDVAGMTLEGQTYQNILPKPTTLIMETDEKEFKINDKIDNNIVLDDNVAEIATIKGQTYVNAVQEESASEYVAMDEELNGQSITTTGKPEGYVKNATLEGLTLVNTIQEPSRADATVLELDADIDAQTATIDNTVQGGIHGAKLNGMTLVNLVTYNKTNLSTSIWNHFVHFSDLKYNLKSSTKYLLIFNITNCNVNSTFTIQLDDKSQYTYFKGKGIYINGNGVYKTIRETKDDLSNISSVLFTAHNPETTSGTYDMKIMIIEYQEGIENLDIPYFEGMKSVEVPSVKTTGKNLFDRNNANIFIGYSGGDVCVSNNNMRSLIFNVKEGCTYTIQKTNESSRFAIDCTIEEPKNATKVKRLFNVNTATEATVTIPIGYNYIVIYYANSEVGDDLNIMPIIQIEEGSTATSYEPYQSSTLTTPSDVILRKVGDVQDELDLETGKLTQRIGEVVFDGSENWTNVAYEHNENYLRFDCSDEKARGISQKLLISDKFITYYGSECEGKTSYIAGHTTLRKIVVIIEKSKLSTHNATGFKEWVSQNPITVQYQLATPTIKTVDLSIVDQDNNRVKSIQTHPTLTHVSTSSQGLIPNIVIPSQLKYPTIIKPSTTYTVQLKHTTVNNDNPLTINLGGTTMAVPSTKFTINTPSELTSQDAIFTGKNNVIGEVVITEGDTTGIDYGFFEGMKDVKSPKLLATGKNLLDEKNTQLYSKESKKIIVTKNTATSATKLQTIKLEKGDYTISVSNIIYDGTTPIEFGFYDFNNSKWKFNSALKIMNRHYTTFSVTETGFYDFALFKHGAGVLNEFETNIQLEEGLTATSYEPYKGVTIEQSIDSIPLTSDMFEQTNIVSVLKGLSYQQALKTTDSKRICTKTIIPIKPNAKYVINNTTSNIDSWYYMFDKNGGFITHGGFDEQGGNGLMTNNAHYIAMVIRYTNNSAITPSDLDSLNLTLQEVTDEIVLRSIGDVKDTLNLTTGEYVQRIGEVVLDGSEDWTLSTRFSSTYNSYYFVLNETFRKNIKYANDKYQLLLGGEDLGKNIGLHMGRDDNNIAPFISSDKMTLSEFKEYLSKNPTTVQYELATPIIKKVNLTNTTKLPSYTSTTHYDTIVPSNSLVPNIKIPSTVDYNVAIKPSTQYTIRVNTTSAMSVNLGGSTGTLANGKVTLTTPSTLAHNSLKLGNGKAKEVMVIEGNEIKDNVPFFNGMKNVQMGGIKLVNIARHERQSSAITANTNKTQFTYTSNGANAYHAIYFDSSLLKTNTVYTVFADITTNTSDNVQPVKFQFGNASGDILDVTRGFVGKIKQTITSANTTKDGLAIVFRPCSSGGQVVIQNPMIIEGDWTHLDEIPFIESEMIIEQPIIRSQGKNLFDGNFIVGDINTTTGNYWGGTTWKATDYIKVKNKGKIVFSSSIAFATANFVIFKYDKDKKYIGYQGAYDNFTTATFNLENSVRYIKIRVPYDVPNNTNIQIEEGSTATSYEPFKQHTLSSNRVIGYEENCYYAATNGVKTTQNAINSMLADVEGLPIAYVTGGSSNYTFWDKDNVFISGKQYLDTSLSSYDKNGFITVPSNAKYMRFAAGGETNAQPLYKVATVTGELPLRSLPNGVCDSFNLVTGEYVQRVGEVVLDGSSDEKWRDYNKPLNNTIAFFTDYNFTGNRYDNCYLISDKLQRLTKTEIAIKDIEGISTDDDNARGYIFIRVDKSKLLTQDINGIEQYLSQNPITVQYELATPIVRKIGLTAKGNYREQVLDGSETWAMDAIDNSKTVRMTKKTVSPLQNPLFDTVLFTDDYHVRARNENHSTYEYITCIGNGIYINIYQSRVNELSVQGCTQWLSQNPIKVGYISSAQSSESYSNIHKPIFFNDVKVQFMNDNVDIQPTLTLQARSRNSYVMDMLKANTQYTLKALKNSNEYTIDGTSYSATTNGTFTSPSTLTNKLLITGQDVYELMIIEGDVTGKAIPYYKGIRSAYDNTNEIEIYSANKNLIDVRKANKLANFNCSFINNGDGSVTLTGTGDGTGEGIIVTDYYFHITAGKHYTFSFESDAPIGNANGTDTVEMFLLKDAQTVAYVNINANKKTFMAHEGDYCLRFDINKNNTTHKFWNIQLVEGDIDTPYQPHQHNTTSLPIPTRLETVEVVRPIMEVGRISEVDGQEDNTDTGSRYSKDYIPVEPNMILTFMNGNAYRAENIRLYGINKNYISAKYTNGSGDLIIPKDCYFIRFYSGASNTNDMSVIKKQYKPIALNSLPNGIKDEVIIDPISNKAKLIQRVGKVVLDGSENWALRNSGTKYSYTVVNLFDGNNCQGICDKFTFISGGSNNSQSTESICSAPTTNALSFFTNNDNLSNINSLKLYLQQNPIAVYYSLATPIVHEISLTGFPFVYEDGSVQLNTELPHKTLVDYNVNQEHLINGQNETIIRHDKQIDNLYDYIELYLEEEYRMELFRMQLELSL